jgi:hypothetical protein
MSGDWVSANSCDGMLVGGGGGIWEGVVWERGLRDVQSSGPANTRGGRQHARISRQFQLSVLLKELTCSRADLKRGLAEATEGEKLVAEGLAAV